MTELNQKSCQACRVGAPKASDAEISEALQSLPGWQVSQFENMDTLEKTYRFANFVSAMEFTQQIAALAESENHHPRLVTEWGKVSVRWWTHKINGLHLNDLICAAKTEQLYQH